MHQSPPDHPGYGRPGPYSGPRYPRTGPLPQPLGPDPHMRRTRTQQLLAGFIPRLQSARFQSSGATPTLPPGLGPPPAGVVGHLPNGLSNGLMAPPRPLAPGLSRPQGQPQGQPPGSGSALGTMLTPEIIRLLTSLAQQRRTSPEAAQFGFTTNEAPGGPG